MAIDQGVAFNNYQFRQTVGDPGRPFLFMVHIPEIGTDTVVTAMARSTQLPQVTVSEVQIPFQGLNMKIGGAPTFEPWTVSFLCDEAHELRRLFMKWNSLIYDVGTGFVGHSNSYKSDKMGVAQLGRQGGQIARYGFVGAYPQVVGSIAVNHGTTGEAEVFDVTFNYDFFVMLDQFGNNTNPGPFVRQTTATQVTRGSAPPGGQWTAFKPQ
jgi:hypothetical protein